MAKWIGFNCQKHGTLNPVSFYVFDLLSCFFLFFGFLAVPETLLL